MSLLYLLFYYIYIFRWVLLFFLFLHFLIVAIVFRAIKQRKALLDKVVIVIAVLLVLILGFDIVKANRYITWERNISTETINVIVQEVKENPEGFYEKLENAPAVMVSEYEEDFDDVLEWREFEESLWWNEYKKSVPLDLLYEDETVSIYQSRVYYCGTNLIIPIEPPYYECELYVFVNGKTRSIEYTSEMLISFNLDKTIAELIES